MLNGIFVGLAFFYGVLWMALSSSSFIETIGIVLLIGAVGYAIVVFKWGSIGAKISTAVFAVPFTVPVAMFDESTRAQKQLILILGSPWIGIPLLGCMVALLSLQASGKSPAAMLRAQILGRAFGSAKWATRWKLRREGMFEKGGLFLGRSHGHDLYHNGEGHLFTIGGTGGGKSSGLVVPALLELSEGSVIVTDPSGELSAMTMRHRRSKGDVVLLNPFAAIFREGTGLDYPDTGFNPLSAIDPKSDTFKAECDAVARLLMVTDRRDSGSYWNDEGAAFLALMIAATLLYEDKEEHTLTRLFSLVRSRTDLIAERLEKIIEHDHPAFRDEAGGFLDVITDSPPQWQGMVRKAATATSRYAPTTPLGEHVSKDGFDVADLKRENVTVYILVPPSQLATALPWMNLLIGVFSRAIGAPGQSRSVTLLIDETPSLGFLPDLQFCMAQFRKVGLRVWLFTQTMSQMQAPELYGREGFEALFGLCTIKQFFALDEPEAQSKLSQLCGEKTARNISDNAGGRSIADVGVPLLRPEEARRLTNWRQIIIKSSMSDPIKAKLVPYFKRKEWRSLVDHNPYREQGKTAALALPHPDDFRTTQTAEKTPTLWQWLDLDSSPDLDHHRQGGRHMEILVLIVATAISASWVIVIGELLNLWDWVTGWEIFFFHIVGCLAVFILRGVDWFLYVWKPSQEEH